jgi:hypothetical protein
MLLPENLLAIVFPQSLLHDTGNVFSALPNDDLHMGHISFQRQAP